MNVPADMLLRPPGVDQGEKDNRQITILPPYRFINAITTEAEPSKDQKKALMLLIHNHPMAGHPG
jgi:hypothetical protein